MKNSLRKNLIVLFSVLLLVCTVFLFIFSLSTRKGKTVYADESRFIRPSLSDSRFEYTEGGYSSHKDFLIENREYYNLGFKIGIKNNIEKDLSNYVADYFTTTLKRPIESYFKFTFKAYRETAGDSEGTLGNPTVVGEQVYIIHAKPKNSPVVEFFCYVLEKDWMSEDSFVIDFSENQINATAYNAPNQSEILNKFGYVGKGYKVVKEYIGLKSIFVNNSIMLRMAVSSPFNAYFIEMDYDYHYCSEPDGLFSSEEYTDVHGCVASSTRSISQILNTMNDIIIDEDEELTALEWEFNTAFLLEDYAESTIIIAINNAMKIITQSQRKNITVYYLEQIADTPYATKKSATVNVPTLNGKVFLDDVAFALGKSTLNCCGSYAYCLESTGQTETYKVRFLEEVWLRSVTTDGNYVDYVLDLNKSYQQTYYPFVEDGIVSEEIFEWVFSNEVIDRYPALHGYEFNNVYGYFGMVVVPKTYTVNSIFKTMFNVDTSQCGVIQNFKFEYNLTYDAYQKLLTDYNYGWLDKAWNGVAGFIDGAQYPANYYWIYSTPGTDRGFINEAGGEDINNPGGVISEKVLKPVANFTGGILDSVSGILSGIGSMFSTAGNIFSNGTFWWILLGIAAVIIVVAIIKKEKK